ncbi:MAG TPA: hypothetical protein DDW67_08255 [Elusimicrobia bacterium]|nr:hypothetical protein [Elusimicrobiota bacterium]
MNINLFFTLASLSFMFPIKLDAYSGKYTDAELSGIFDSASGVKLDTAALPEPAVPLPAPANVSNRPGIDLEEICRGKDLCFLDNYINQLQDRADIQTHIQWIIQDLYESFHNYAQDLNPEEERTIGDALSALRGTTAGTRLCVNLGAAECSIKSLTEKKILIKAKNLPGEEDAKTLVYAGKVLVVINRKSDLKSLNWAHILGHELSHAEDYKKFKRALTDTYRLSTETKAHLTQLHVYNELKGKFPSAINRPALNFLIQFWNWKENGGKYPGNFMGPDGGIVSAEKLINAIGPVNRGVEGVRGMVLNYFYIDLPMNTTLSVNDPLQWEMLRGTVILGYNYNYWRSKNPGLANPATSSGSYDHGSGNGPAPSPDPGPVSPWPFNPNPHFQDGI